MVLLVISGYKPHLALLGWCNGGGGGGGCVWGGGRGVRVPLRGKCITIHGEREKEVVQQKVAAASLRWV